MEEESQVNLEEGNQGVEQQTESLGWRAGLPNEWKEHEFVKPYKTVGEFVKSVYSAVSERDALKAKLERAIFKPSENATEAEKEAYFKAIGRPDKPEDYEFNPPQGGELDPGTVKWARSVFHKAGLTKEQAAMIGDEWNSFVAGMVEAEERLAKEERDRNEREFRAKFKSEDEWREGYALAKRFWNKITNTEFDDVYKEVDAWQIPLFMNFIFGVARMTGEDTSPGRGKPGGGEVREGMIYDKSPPPPTT